MSASLRTFDAGGFEPLDIARARSEAEPVEDMKRPIFGSYSGGLPNHSPPLAAYGLSGVSLSTAHSDGLPGSPRYGARGSAAEISGRRRP